MKFKTFLQYVIPQHTFSRWMGLYTRCRFKPIKQWSINKFIRRYDVDMREALQPDSTAYEHFQAFFTRKLQPGARPIAPQPQALISPVDGVLVQFGTIHTDTLLQAKGHTYTLAQLLGEADPRFCNGQFASFYLSPKDYHRVHMPFTGDLRMMRYIPGKLFSVNADAVNCIPGLFTRNERVVCFFETERGPMAVIFIGALFVGSICTAWQDVVTPHRPRQITRWDYPGKHYQRGDEIGYFNMGSAVIVLFADRNGQWENALQPGCAVKMGQKLLGL